MKLKNIKIYISGANNIYIIYYIYIYIYYAYIHITMLFIYYIHTRTYILNN